MTAPRISLVVTTYEAPDALHAVLRSITRQSMPPLEVVVGDDGSGPETAHLLSSFADGPFPVRHRWLPHDGFRASRARNCAVAACSGDYLIIIDGDILLHPDFVADHAAAARPGFFVQGSRALLSAEATRIAQTRDAYWPSPWDADVENRKNTVRSHVLSRLFSRPAKGLRGIRTCNFAVWREDFVRVNGFNEDFVGWGREDSEFAARLLNAGVRRRNLRFLALGCHMHHPPRSRDAVAANDVRLAAAVEPTMIRCPNGLNLHMEEDPADESPVKERHACQ